MSATVGLGEEIELNIHRPSAARDRIALGTAPPQGREFRPTAARGNLLLGSLPPSELARIEPHLTPLELTGRMILEAPGEAIDKVVFPASGVVSMVATIAGGRHIEVGLIGREGMSGITVVMGDDRAAHECSVQVAGQGDAIATGILQKAMAASAALRGTFLRYVQTYMVQTAHTALANGRAKIEERTARWLLMAHDRIGEDELPLTHDLLSLMLGVRRAGVTDAVHRLEGEGIIRARRSLIVIRDRGRLERAANGAYGGPEQEYQRLMGFRPDSIAGSAPPRGSLARSGRARG